MNPPPDTFATERLWARRPRLDDAPAIFAAYAADPEVTRYLAWLTHESVDTLRDYLQHPIVDWETGASFRYELCLRDTDNPVGSIHLRPEGNRVMIGYVLARPLWGRGLMAEALRFAIDWALAQPDVHRAYAFCDVQNPGSARVMEKAGMEREGILRCYHVCPNLSLQPRDCFMYAKVR
jgi:ribosomal-protein-alanine N-acetyltransferase